jgi:hypothetical protein
MGTKPSLRRSDTDDIDPPVTSEVEAELRKRLETFEGRTPVGRRARRS